MQNVAPPPPVEVASSIRTARTMSTAPRLSLRPVTQFSPTLNENRKSGGNMLVAVPVVGKEVPSPPSIRSENGTVPPSPAWTEDIPASPGPAPTGPPPIAVAGGNANGPAPAPAGPNNVHRVQLDFKPSMNDELELHAGQLVRMLHEYDDGWALCVRMDRSQQGVVPRTCLSKHPMKPRTGPPRQSPPGAAVPRMRGPPVGPHMGPGAPQPRPLSPASGRSSPHPPSLSPANGRMSPGPRSIPMNPNANLPMPARKPLPGQAM
ncbi:hypothetical protein K469DRAFT_648648 [Zopfia rhizophila CBS 207.26]|uniref:SH3 domain-containing protein n=1 Tax=Zopfia rhizophila CBS 207.26 TaxID=1314779 RepID=A0A6A6ESF3_9PEZI|nr:hypothetical protein K469DRAFT_648648 [Zopfia rhizophila CBS 207.26]